jgi:hypothetical protein
MNTRRAMVFKGKDQIAFKPDMETAEIERTRP